MTAIAGAVGERGAPIRRWRIGPCRSDAARNDDLLSFISDRGKFDWHKEAVINILKSPNLRKVLLKGTIKRGTNISIGNYLRTYSSTT